MLQIIPKLINKHFTPSVTRKTKIVLHWSTTKTLQQIYDTFMGERKASAQYGISEDGTVWQFVNDEHIAWHAGIANSYSIGIEHCGGYLLSDGSRAKPTQACHDKSAELLVQLSIWYGIEINNNNIKPHNYYMATACPGSLDINYIISKANKIMDDKLKGAIEWNEAIKAKKLSTEFIDLVPEPISNASKLINKLDTRDKELLLIKLKDLNDWLRTSTLKNSKELVMVLKRYAYYINKTDEV